MITLISWLQAVRKVIVYGIDAAMPQHAADGLSASSAARLITSKQPAIQQGATELSSPFLADDDIEKWIYYLQMLMFLTLPYSRVTITKKKWVLAVRKWSAFNLPYSRKKWLNCTCHIRLQTLMLTLPYSRVTVAEKEAQISGALLEGQFTICHTAAREQLNCSFHIPISRKQNQQKEPTCDTVVLMYSHNLACCYIGIGTFVIPCLQ